MGNNSSKVLEDPPMAEEVAVDEPNKRRIEDVDINWPAESEMQQALEKKRKLEDEEPYNDARVRQKAKIIGIKEASRSSVSDISRVSQNVTPRGLSSQGDESSEFVSGEESQDDAAPAQFVTPGGTEDEMGKESGSEEADQEAEENVVQYGSGEAVNGGIETAKAAREPETEFDFAGMMARSDETVARIMRGYSSLPSRSRPQEDVSAQDKEGSEEEEEEEEEEDDNEEGGAVVGGGQDEEMQVVQDSIVLDNASRRPILDAVAGDSGHGSMESENHSQHEETTAEELGALAQDGASLPRGSQDRISAAGETVRRIQAERNAFAAVSESRSANGVSEDPAEIEIPPAPAPGEPESPARLAYKASRKQRKKIRQAHLKEWKKTTPGPSPRVKARPASEKRKQHKLPPSHPGLNDAKFWQSKLWDAQKKLIMLEKREDRSAVKQRRKVRRRAARASEKLRKIQAPRGASAETEEDEGGVEVDA